MMRRLLAFFDSTAGRAARYGFSVLLIAALIWKVDWRAVERLRGQFAVGPAVLAALVAGATFPLHAWRWWLLLRALGLSLPFRWAHTVTWIGTFYNAFLLGGLGGDAARVFYICRDEPDRKSAGVAATLLDRVLGLVVLMSVAACALFLELRVVASHPQLRVLFGLCIVLAGSGVFVLIALGCRPPVWFTRWIGVERATQLLAICQRAGSAKRALTAALIVSYGIWLMDFLSVWLLAQSIGFPLPFPEVCLTMSIAYAATVLPVSVGGHGVREGTMLGVLTLLGFVPGESARQHALLLAVFVWAVSVFWSLIGGTVLLAARRLLRPRQAA